MVIDRRKNIHASSRIDAILRQLEIQIVPFDREMSWIARTAFEHYGKGSGHAASLNYGDCMAYALAKQTDEPLLFIGNDFTHTDVTPALA